MLKLSIVNMYPIIRDIVFPVLSNNFPFLQDTHTLTGLLAL